MINIFVVDTNNLISANLLPGSISRKAYDRARQIGILVYSEATLAEFVNTFSRTKFDKYLSHSRRKASIEAYEKRGQLIAVSAEFEICRDPKDNKFLELAVSAGAKCIITGDKDLLVLNPFEGIPILSAADFLNTF